MKYRIVIISLVTPWISGDYNLKLTGSARFSNRQQKAFWLMFHAAKCKGVLPYSSRWFTTALRAILGFSLLQIRVSLNKPRRQCCMKFPPFFWAGYHWMLFLRFSRLCPSLPATSYQISVPLEDPIEMFFLKYEAMVRWKSINKEL